MYVVNISNNSNNKLLLTTIKFYYFFIHSTKNIHENVKQAAINNTHWKPQEDQKNI